MKKVISGDLFCFGTSYKNSLLKRRGILNKQVSKSNLKIFRKSWQISCKIMLMPLEKMPRQKTGENESILRRAGKKPKIQILRRKLLQHS